MSEAHRHHLLHRAVEGAVRNDEVVHDIANFLTAFLAC
jgi:hypothetical protein